MKARARPIAASSARSLTRAPGPSVSAVTGAPVRPRVPTRIHSPSERDRTKAISEPQRPGQRPQSVACTRCQACLLR